MSAIETRLSALGVTLPDAPAPAANYVPYVQVGAQVYISGQISRDASGLITGKLGATLDVAQGAEAAKTCAIALLAQLKAACGGDLDRVVRAVKLVGFVNSTPDFTDQPKVALLRVQVTSAGPAYPGAQVHEKDEAPGVPSGGETTTDAAYVGKGAEAAAATSEAERARE